MPDADKVARVAGEWQDIGTMADLWAVHGARGGAGPDRSLELAGRMASAGEQLGLALTAAIEVAFWHEAIRQSAHENPGHEMCLRALAELQSHFVLSTGHGLGNIAARALALDKGLRALLKKRLRTEMPPFSNDKRDWKSLNGDLVQHLQGVAKVSPNPQVQDLVQPILVLAHGISWHRLVDRRGKDFHQWRPQTEGLAGVRQESPVVQNADGSWMMGVGFGDADHGAESLGIESATVAHDGMVALAGAMEEFIERFAAACGQLGCPALESN